MRERLRATVSGERGFTLIELMVAATVCLAGLVAMVSVFDGSRELVNEAERNEAAAHRAQRALEEAVALPYDQLALEGTTPPSHSTDPLHPNHRVTTSGTYTWRLNPTATAPFVMNGAVAHSSSWADPELRLSGTIYRYVTTYDDPSLAGTVNGKRVTVAVTVRNRRRAVMTSTIVRDRSEP